MSAVRPPGSDTEQTDDDLEEGGQGAFGQLVLPPGHKKMVLSLISQHFRNKESQESNDKQVDIVRGKGKSSLMKPIVPLLCSARFVSPLTNKSFDREGIDHSAAWSTRSGQNNNRRYVSTSITVADSLRPVRTHIV